MTLPTYRPDAVCPKCGHDDVGVTYKENVNYGSPIWPRMDITEHLLRTCRRCHYQWAEAVLSTN